VTGQDSDSDLTWLCASIFSVRQLPHQLLKSCFDCPNISQQPWMLDHAAHASFLPLAEHANFYKLAIHIHLFLSND